MPLNIELDHCKNVAASANKYSTTKASARLWRVHTMSVQPISEVAMIFGFI